MEHIVKARNLDKAYLEAKPKSYYSAGPSPNPNRLQQQTAYWGVPQMNEDRTPIIKRGRFTLKRVGVKGNATLPLFQMCAWHIEANGPSKTTKKLVAGRFAVRVAQQLLPEEQRLLLTRKKPKTCLVSLFRPSFGSYPPADLAGPIKRAAIKVFCEIAAVDDIKSVEIILDDPSLTSPGDVLKALYRAFPPPSAKLPGLASAIDPWLMRHKKMRPSLFPMFGEVKAGLASTDLHHRTQFVIGPPYAGKSTIVKALLDDLKAASPDDQHELACPIDPDVTLPVFAIYCGSRTVGDILNALHQWLVERRNPFSSQTVMNPTGINSDGAKLAMIQRRTKFMPCFFIFYDVSLLDNGVFRSVRDQQIESLISTLVTSNNQNRVLVTAQRPEGETQATLDTLPVKGTTIRIPEQTVEHIYEFVDGHIKVAVQEGLTLFAKSLADPETLLKASVPGHLLVAYSGMCQLYLVRTEKDKQDDVSKHVDPLLTEHFCKAALTGENGSSTCTPHLDAFYARLWEIHKAGVKHGHLHRVILLMLASDDGLVLSSIDDLLAQWHAHEPLDKDPDEARVGKHIRAWARLSKSRLITLVQSSRLNPNEWTTRETVSFRQTEDFRNISLDEPTRMSIVKAVKAVDEDDLSMAYSLVASRARERALTVKLKSHGLYGQGRSDLRRDIQAYSALNASALPSRWFRQTGQIHAKITQIPATHQEDYVFDPSNRHDIPSILWFAHKIIFREEIDAEHKLTMWLDEDALRLNLLLRLFCPGSAEFPEGSGEACLKLGFQDYHDVAFDELEKMLLLESIAISALNSSRIDILDQSQKLAEPLFEVTHDDRVRKAYINIVCVIADSKIEGFGTFQSDRLSEYHVLNKQLNDLESLCTQRMNTQRVDYLEASRRLKIRRLLLKRALNHPSHDSLTLLNEVVHLQNQIARQSGQSTSGFSGKGARLLTRVFLGDLIFDDEGLWRKVDWLSADEYKLILPKNPWNTASVLKPTPQAKLKSTSEPKKPPRPMACIAEHFLDRMIKLGFRRKSRFAGGEQVNLIICRVQQHLLAADLENARIYKDVVEDLLMFSGISVTLRAELEWVLAQTDFLEARSHLPSPNPTDKNRDRYALYNALNDAVTRARFLRGFALKNRLLDFEVRATLLLGKISILCLRLKLNADDFGLDCDRIVQALSAVIKNEALNKAKGASHEKGDRLQVLPRYERQAGLVLSELDYRLWLKDIA